MSVYSESKDVTSLDKMKKKNKKDVAVDILKQKRKIVSSKKKKNERKTIGDFKNIGTATKKKKSNLKLEKKLKNKLGDLYSCDINPSTQNEKFSSQVNKRLKRKSKVGSEYSNLKPKSSIKRINEKNLKFRNHGQPVKTVDSKKATTKHKKNLKKKVNSEFCGKT